MQVLGFSGLETAAAVSSGLTLVGGITYCVAIVRSNGEGDFIPTRSTWFIWSFMSVIIALSYKDSGAQETVWMAWALALEYIASAILCIWYGQGNWAARDLVCLFGALVSSAVWYWSGNAHVALLALLALDAFGAYPTLRKVMTNSAGEPFVPWFFTALGGIANMFAVDWSHPTFWILVYPIYMLVINTWITGSLLRPKSKTEW